MKYRSLLSLSVLLVNSAILPVTQAAPGDIIALSANVAGTLTNNYIRPGGCPNLVCTTNMVTISRCFTNCQIKPVCITNVTGQIQCTNTIVCETRCFTNTFPEITCTNELTAPALWNINQSISGVLTPEACTEFGGPNNLIFQASLLTSIRTNDWRGSHIGTFKILDGTNVVAFGGVTGINGAGTHRGLEPCGICNHLEGTLRGIVMRGPLAGSRLQAAYAGNLVNLQCPSATVPQGAIALGIEGVVTVPCVTFATPGTVPISTGFPQ